MEENHYDLTENNEEPEIVAPASYSMMEGKTYRLDDVLNEKLERAFHKQTSQLLLHDVAKIAIEHDPIDLAYAAPRLPSGGRIVVYENLPDMDAKVIFMVNTTRNTRLVIFRHINDFEIKELIERMPTDEAIIVLEDIPDRRFKRVLDILEPKKSERIRERQKHLRNSAGRLMTEEFFSFSMQVSIGEVSRNIRDHPGVDLMRSIFVLTDKQELAGYVPVRNLIVNPPYLPLRQVMRPVLHSVKPDASRDEVIDIVERYSIPTLPVVDESDKLIGVIAYEDVLEAMEDAADETIASIAGTAENVSEHEPIFTRFLWRVPWLVVTLLAGMVTSTALSQFSGRAWFAFVPFFVPLIAGMSGNVGLQMSTVLVRGMATGQLPPGSRWEAMLKEITIGLLIGTIFGITCGFMIYILNILGIQHTGDEPVATGILISTGLFGATMTATFLGTFSPFFFVRIGVDPAVAAGPIITAFNDVFSTMIFLLISYFIYFLIY